MNNTKHHVTDAHHRIWLRNVAPSIVVFLVATGLCILGLLVLYSVGRSQPVEAISYFSRQIVWLAIAAAAFVTAWHVPLEWLRRLIWPIAIASLALLVVVLIPGIGLKINGAQRWISLGAMNMQVSDFAKVGMIFVMAHYLALNQRSLGDFWRGFAIPCMIFGLVFALVLLQPDYGTAFLCASVGAVLLFLAGARLLFLIPTAVCGVALFSLAIMHDPVRLNRILAFLDVEANRGDGAYQLWQATLAFGVGGVNGVGLGNGRQQMAFLPEAHTDFIFPIIGEELGLFFTGGVVILFLILFFVVAARLRSAPNLFHFLLVAGVLLTITFQALVNFGVTTGLLPTKGLSLPFISYGGSNLVVTFIMLGLIMNCFRDWNKPIVRQATEVMA